MQVSLLFTVLASLTIALPRRGGGGGGNSGPDSGNFKGKAYADRDPFANTDAVFERNRNSGKHFCQGWNEATQSC